MRSRSTGTLGSILVLSLLLPSGAQSQTESIAEFSGNGTLTTRPFHAAERWEITWDAAGDLFQVLLYRSDGSLADVPASQQGPGGGDSFQPEAGSYYLQVNASGDWSIEVSTVPAPQEGVPPPGAPLFTDRGDGAKNTRPFLAGGPWEVTWDASGDLFQMFVYRTDSSLAGVAANQTGSGNGSSLQPEAGEFYLQVNAIGSWELQVKRVE